MAARGLFDLACGTVAVGEFAFELRDQLSHGFLGDFLEARGVLDRLVPVAFGLVDADQVLERLRRAHVEVHEVAEHGLGAIEQARAHVVLAEREQRLHLLLVIQVRSLHQRLVQADRAIDFAAAAEQMAERDLGLEGVLVEFRDAQEHLDRLVGLLVEQVVEAAEIRRRQPADLAVAMAFAAAPADQPAGGRRDRQQQEEPEPFVDEGHASGSRRPGDRLAGRADSTRRRRWRKGKTTLAARASPPTTTPNSNATSTATPSDVGNCANPRSSCTALGIQAAHGNACSEAGQGDQQSEQAHRATPMVAVRRPSA